MSRGPSRTGGQSDLPAEQSALPAEQSALLGGEATRVNLTCDESETRRSTIVPVATSETPAPQGPSAVTRMFGCLFQAGSAPFKLMWNYPRTTAALLVTAANAVAQSCMYGTPGFEGAPQQYCNDAAKAMMDNKMVVTGMAGTLFAMGAHMATDAVSRYRASRAEPEADIAVRAAM